MNEYIELKLALNKLWRLCEEDIDAEKLEAFDFSRAREALSDLPTIDIVYCVECRYKGMIICPMHNLTRAGVLQPSDFCSYGDRMEK